METDPFRPADAPEDAISLRLARVAGRARLLVASKGLCVRGRDAVDGSPWSIDPVRLSPASHGIEWDATAPDGRWSAVTTVPGSSLCSLCLMDPAGDLSTRDLPKPREVLRRPRFVRGRDRLLTAVDEIDPLDMLVKADRAADATRSAPRHAKTRRLL